MGFVVLATFISPYRKDRDFIRELHMDNNLMYKECYMSTDLETCKLQDVKGLYKKAISGEIKNFTGITAPYEAPLSSDFRINQNKSIEENVNTILHLFDNIIELTHLDMEWLQVIEEGWCSPLKGFMKENDYLSCLHFSMISRDRMYYNQSIPIILSCPKLICGKVYLIYENELIATLHNTEVYSWNKEEMINRIWGTNYDIKHPYIEMLMKDENKYLIGGDVFMKKDIWWNDGLDNYRLSPKEIKDEIEKREADCVVAFQTRNPLHNGHVYMIKETLERMKHEYKNPILLLHPIGGYTKDDDVPLHIRMEQYKALELENTLLAIFPSPMMYSGPRCAQWHAKTRKIAGATHIIAGRDMAGINDLYDYSHARKTLLLTPFLNIDTIPFTAISYNQVEKKMMPYDYKKADEFLHISGSKMREIAREGGELPEGFMDEKGWQILKKYYE
jgi:3'-phosphoadenosine 5'-phosphosulfate synthase